MNKKLGKTNIDELNYSKRLVLSIVSIVTVLYEYFIVTKSGTYPSWGTPQQFSIFFFQTTNMQLFLFFCMLGSTLLFFSSWKVIDTLNIMFFNNKSMQIAGLISYFLGILSYFNFIVFEPFIILYLSVVLVLFYYLVTFNISPFYQQNYQGFPIITKYSFWDVETKTFMNNFLKTQKLDIVLLLLILILMLQFVLVIANTDTGFAIRKNSLLAKLIKKQISLDQADKHDSLNILAIFIIYQYGLSLLYIFNNNLFLAFFLLSVIIPVYQRKAISGEILRLKAFPIKIYDMYIFNFLLISVIALLFGVFSQLDQLLYVVLFWITLNIIKIINMIKNRHQIQKNDPVKFEITFYKFSYALYYMTIILYIASWLKSYDEGFFLTLFLITTLMRYNSFFRDKIFKKDLLIFIFKKLIIFFSSVLVLVGFLFFFISFMENGNIFNSLNIVINCPMEGCNFTGLNNTKNLIGMKNPSYIQFFNWIGAFLLGVFGFVFSGVQIDILQGILPTLEISALPFILTFILLILIKKYPGVHGNWIFNQIKSKSTYLLRSTPIFVLSIFLIIISVYLNLIPTGGLGLNIPPSKTTFFYSWLYINGIVFQYSFILMNITIFTINLPTISISCFITWTNYNLIFHLILPILTIIIFTLTTFSKLFNSLNSKILNSNYILSARASGFDDTTILTKFVYKNSILTLIKQSRKTLLIIFAMDPIFEIIFYWNGIGFYAISLLLNFAIFPLLSIVFIFTGLILLSFLVIDILNFLFNPTSKEQEEDLLKMSNLTKPELIQTFH